VKPRWFLIVTAAVMGTTAFSLLSAAGLRAGLSYLGGLVLVVGAFEFGAFNIRLAGRYLPSMTLLVAMLSYTTTAVALGLVLAASSPRVVHGMAVSIGLFLGVAIWIGTELARSIASTKAWSGRPEGPVSIASHDEPSSST
jgi:hypothetical protein